MSHISKNLARILSSLPDGVRLVAVSKFHPASMIEEAYAAGQRAFGESRANEFVAKAKSLPSDIEWHFIGHLQTNKVRQIIPYTYLIQSVDSDRLLRVIDSESQRIGRRADVLLQVHVAKEETKFGSAPDELMEYAASLDLDDVPGVRIRGVMGMASNVDDETRVRADFEAIAATFNLLREGPFCCCHDFDTLSMGMSSDFRLAVDAGSNMVRIGSDIFGERDY